MGVGVFSSADSFHIPISELAVGCGRLRDYAGILRVSVFGGGTRYLSSNASVGVICYSVGNRCCGWFDAKIYKFFSETHTSST